MSVRWMSAAALWIALTTMITVGVPAIAAEEIGHYGTNRVTFERAGSAPADAKGKGIVDYRGGAEPDSRWRASFKFNHLKDNRKYTVVVEGRFGEDGSEEAENLTEICSFETNDKGKGNCFRYFSGLARLDVMQLRVGDENGARAMQADRNGDYGAITTEPSRYSPGGEIPEREPLKSRKRARK